MYVYLEINYCVMHMKLTQHYKSILCCCCLVTRLCQTLLQPHGLARQAPLSKEFSRQEYWSGLPFPSSEHLSNQGLNPHHLHWQADSLPNSTPI